MKTKKIIKKQKKENPYSSLGEQLDTIDKTKWQVLFLIGVVLGLLSFYSIKWLMMLDDFHSMIQVLPVIFWVLVMMKLYRIFKN